MRMWARRCMLSDSYIDTEQELELGPCHVGGDGRSTMDDFEDWIMDASIRVSQVRKSKTSIPVYADMEKSGCVLGPRERGFLTAVPDGKLELGQRYEFQPLSCRLLAPRVRLAYQEVIADGSTPSARRVLDSCIQSY